MRDLCEHAVACCHDPRGQRGRDAILVDVKECRESTQSACFGACVPGIKICIQNGCYSDIDFQKSRLFGFNSIDFISYYLSFLLLYKSQLHMAESHKLYFKLFICIVL